MTAMSWSSAMAAARDVDALGVGAGVGRGEMEAGVVDEVVEEGDVDGGEAFELIGLRDGAKGEAEPEAFGAGTGEEGAAGEALGVDGVVEVEVADVADVLDVVEKNGDDVAAEVEQVDAGWAAVADKAGERQVAGEGFSGEAADDDLFVGRKTWVWRIVARARAERSEKGAERVANSSSMC